MPFNFPLTRYYSIDYDHMFTELDSTKILKNPKLQKFYLASWIDLLKECDHATDKNPETLISQNISQKHQLFQLPITLKSHTLFIHFSISEFLKDMPRYKKFIDLKEFTSKQRKIHWTAVTTTLNPSLVSEDPIIVIPFYRDKYSHLVIDGNHRITFKVQNEINDIYAIFTSIQKLSQSSVFPTAFDKLFYIFINELSHIFNASQSGREDEQELVNKSFIFTRNYNF